MIKAVETLKTDLVACPQGQDLRKVECTSQRSARRICSTCSLEEAQMRLALALLSTHLAVDQVRS